MTIEQKILKEVKAVKDMVKEIPNQKEWLTEPEACELLGIKVDRIRQLRYNGTLTNIRCRASGRGFQYNRKEVESLLIQVNP